MSGFNAGKFNSAVLAPRTQDVPVPDLAAWFDDSDPVWRVRGLTANEIAKTRVAGEARRRESAFAAALATGSKSEIIAEVQHAIGRSDSVEPDLARRLEMLTLGSVDPLCPLDVAVRLAEHFPTVFYQLTDRILTLTGLGSDVEKKPKRSTEKPESETA
jgi:hypothetical protein